MEIDKKKYADYILSLIHISVEDAIVKSDLTDMTDIMMELIKERDGSKR